eukprot:m51a1_g7672 hypothetical protein (504) ;mRNA; r:488880-490626
MGFWDGIFISFYALPNATGQWQVMGTTGQNSSTFDTRKRPYYQTAAEHPTGEHRWGDVYLAVPEGYLCTAVSRTWTKLGSASTAENYCGAAVVLMGLKEISSYLQTHRLGETHVWLVSLDADRSIIASSTSALIGRTGSDGETLRMPIELSEDRLTRGVGSATRRMHDGQFRKASVASKDYYLYTESVDVRPGLGFPTIGVIVAVEVRAYFADIQRSTLITTIIAAVLAVVSVLLSTMFSVLISRPLRVIVRQMDRISRLESARYLDSISKVANLSEIDSIDNSMQRMSILINSFHKYVPLQVLKLLLKNGEIAQLHVSRHKCSIMFCDIENFTPLTASTGPEVLLRVFTEFMDICTECIDQNKGLVDKMIGDCVMAFWGHPGDEHDTEFNCCTAALAIRARLGVARDSWSRNGLPQLNCRIGIATGQVLAGNSGSSSHFNYTVLGSPVNLAARLEPLNKALGTRILACSKTREAVAERVVTRHVASCMIKGFEELQDVRWTL